ncbi:MAG: hypothetical protein ACRD0I_00040 [Acidimicrobiales bacterium]
MSLRIEIELTSARGDGTWTWRAAGARQPKGVLNDSILYPGAVAGDVVRAEATVGIDGTTINSVQPPKAAKKAEAVIELIPSNGEFQAVTSTLTSKASGRPRPPRDKRPTRLGERLPSRNSGGRAANGTASHTGMGTGQGHGRSTPVTGPAGTRRSSGQPVGSDAGARSRIGGRASPAPDSGTGAQRGRPAPREDARSRRFSPGTKHRRAAVEAMLPEQRPIAEQLLKAGMPGVRQAISAQNAQAKEQGLPEVAPEPLLTMAETLLPVLKAATWRDRAEAAMAELATISLRDLRSVVTGSEALARDDETRMLVGNLREALEARVAKLRQNWVDEITRAIDEGKLVRALRASARTPEPTARFPAELAVRLGEAAGTNMSSELSVARWVAMMEAVADSPVRRSVKPVGLPRDSDAEFVEHAKHLCGKIPGLASLLGMNMPPPPGPSRPSARPNARPPRPPTRSAPAAPLIITQTTEPTGPECEATEPTVPEGEATEPTVPEGEATEPTATRPQAEVAASELHVGGPEVPSHPPVG